METRYLLGASVDNASFSPAFLFNFGSLPDCVEMTVFLSYVRLFEEPRFEYYSRRYSLWSLLVSCVSLLIPNTFVEKEGPYAGPRHL